MLIPEASHSCISMHILYIYISYIMDRCKHSALNQSQPISTNLSPGGGEGRHGGPACVHSSTASGGSEGEGIEPALMNRMNNYSNYCHDLAMTISTFSTRNGFILWHFQMPRACLTCFGAWYRFLLHDIEPRHESERNKTLRQCKQWPPLAQLWRAVAVVQMDDRLARSWARPWAPRYRAIVPVEAATRLREDDIRWLTSMLW